MPLSKPWHDRCVVPPPSMAHPAGSAYPNHQAIATRLLRASWRQRLALTDDSGATARDQIRHQWLAAGPRSTPNRNGLGPGSTWTVRLPWVGYNSPLIMECIPSGADESLGTRR